MKKIALIILAGLGVRKLIVNKKAEIQNTVVNLEFKLKAVYGLDINSLLQKTINFKVSVNITNPTENNLDISFLTVKRIDVYLPTDTLTPFASTKTPLTNIVINNGETITLNNIDVEVPFLSVNKLKKYIFQGDGIINAIQRLNSLKDTLIIKPQVEIKGQTYVV